MKLGRKHFRVTEDFKFTQKNKRESTIYYQGICENYKEEKSAIVGRIIYLTE